MCMLEVRLLGAPSLTWQQAPFAIERRQVRALIYRLAAEMQPVPREYLCWLFWPDAAESEAHRNLSHLLTHLRSALPFQEILSCINDTILLNPQTCWSDSATFQALVGDRLGIHSINDAERAVALYRGPFLDSFALDHSSEYESWVTLHRSVLEKHYLAALSLLAEKECTNQNYTTAISYLQCSLAVDPFNEELHRRLMEIYAAAGNRIAALREFDDYSDTLRREMAMEPLPETQAFIRNLCNGNHGDRIHSYQQQMNDRVRQL